MIHLFSMIAKELKNFTNKVSGDIRKMTQAYNTSQEKMGKLIENAISQAPTKAKGITTLATPIDTRNIRTNFATPLHKTSWTSAWPTHNYKCHNSHKSMHIKFIDLTKITYLHQHIKPTIPQSNLFRPQSISCQIL